MKKILIYRGDTGCYSISNRKKIYQFIFAVYSIPNKAKNGWGISICKIDGEPHQTDRPLCGKPTKSQAIKWIDKFCEWDESRQIEFLSKKGIDIYIPQSRHYVSLSIVDEKGRKTNEIIEKALLRHSSESIESFDGIDRIKEALLNHQFVGTSGLVLVAKGNQSRRSGFTKHAINGKSVFKSKLVNFKIKSR